MNDGDQMKPFDFQTIGAALVSLAVCICGSIASASPEGEWGQWDCDQWAIQTNWQARQLGGNLSGRPVVIGDVVSETRYGRNFDFLEFNAENVDRMLRLSRAVESAQFYLELPNPCDERQLNGIVVVNPSVFDGCYEGVTKWLIGFSWSPDSIKPPITEEIFDGTNFLDFASRYEVAGYADDLLDTIRSELAKTSLGDYGRFSVHVEELSRVVDPHGERERNIVPYYLERKIIVSGNSLYSKLVFRHNGTDLKWAEFIGKYSLEGLTPACTSENTPRLDQDGLIDLIVEQLLLKTN